MEVFLSADAWIALLTLTFLEIVLGIDNIIFISIATGNYTEESRKKSNKDWDVSRHVYAHCTLLGISYLIAMKEPWFTINFGWVHSFLDKVSYSC
jgi:predicted tellurium resistance membrane protein TerC